MPLPRSSGSNILVTATIDGTDGDTVTIPLAMPTYGTSAYDATFGFRLDNDDTADWELTADGVTALVGGAPLVDIGDPGSLAGIDGITVDNAQELVTVTNGATLSATCTGSDFTITWFVLLVPVSVITVQGA